jgi:hypothetical protein
VDTKGTESRAARLSWILKPAGGHPGTMLRPRCFCILWSRWPLALGPEALWDWNEDFSTSQGLLFSRFGSDLG